jgi:steroid delta-isomerase-like uncharacterized protein
MSDIDTDELLERFEASTVAAWNRGEVDGIDDLFAADVAVHEVPTGNTYEGLDEFKDWIRGIRTGFPDFALDEEASTFFVADDRIVSQWVFTGTHEGRLPGLDAEPTNQSVELTGATIYAMDGQTVTEAWWYFDMMGLMGQLGLVPEELLA